MPTKKDNKLHEMCSLEEIIIRQFTKRNDLLIELHIQNCGCEGRILENLYNLKITKLSLCNNKKFLLGYDDHGSAFSKTSFTDKDLKCMASSSPLTSLCFSIIFIYTIRKMQFD